MGVFSSIAKNYSSAADNLGVMKKAGNYRLGGALGTGMTVLGSTLGTNRRLKQGERFLPSVGKELAINAKYSLAPQLILFELGKAGISGYFGQKDSIEERQAFSKNYNFMGGEGFMDTETNHANRARGMEQIKRNRASIGKHLGNEAKRYHR